MRRNRSTTQAARMLEHAVRLATRMASNSMSGNTTGKLVRDLQGYVELLKRYEERGEIEKFYKVLRNAQMKLLKLVRRLLH